MDLGALKLESLVPEQRARVAGSGRGGPGGRPDRCPAWALGDARHLVGAAHQRGVHRVYRAARGGRHRDRLRRGRPAAARGRDQHTGAVGDFADRHRGGRVRAGNAAVRRRAGGVHRRRSGPVQPAAAGRLEAGPAPGPGRGDWLCREPGGGCPVLAAGRLFGGRRRSRRRLPARRRVPDPGGGLGPGHPARSAGHSCCGRHRGDTAGRGAPRLPRGAGREAAVKGGPVDAGGGHHAAQAHLHLAGQPAGAGVGQAPPSGPGPRAGRAGA